MKCIVQCRSSDMSNWRTWRTFYDVGEATEYLDMVADEDGLDFEYDCWQIMWQDVDRTTGIVSWVDRRDLNDPKYQPVVEKDMKPSTVIGILLITIFLMWVVFV